MTEAAAGDAGVRFYFDYISHNAYLAWTQIHALCARHGMQVHPVPVLFAGLLNATGQLGPAEIPAKSLWMLRDCVRKAKQLGVAFNPPASHPFNPLLALRTTAAVMPGAQRDALISALFEAVWVNGQDVNRASVVAAAATAVGLDGGELVRAANAETAKRALRRATEEAIDGGVFGVPSMVFNGTVYWGFDDLVHLDSCLAGNETVHPDDMAPWLLVKPSASRRR